MPKICITVCVKPRSKRESIEFSQLTNITTLKINAPPVDQKANLKVVEILCKVLKIPQSKISIVKGLSYKIKEVEIATELALDEIYSLIAKSSIEQQKLVKHK